MTDRNELIFELKGVKPDQLPMTRMSMYMKEFACLLGGKGEAIFSDVRLGSTCIAAKFVAGGASTARKRVIRAGQGHGAKDAQTAFQKLAEMASEDGVPARVVSQSATIIHFPRVDKEPTPLAVHQFGQVTGRLTGVVDDESGAKARIRPVGGGGLIYATAPETIADNIGQYFRRCVRIKGWGSWQKDAQGIWTCSDIQIVHIRAVEDATIKQAIEAVGQLDITWADNPFDGLDSVGTA